LRAAFFLGKPTALMPECRIVTQAMTAYEEIHQELLTRPRSWLVTGVAGFIGSHLLETLLRWNQQVIGLDNFATGRKQNLEEVRHLVQPGQWARFTFFQGDILDPVLCRRACQGVDYVLHQAALGSVPQSIEDPLRFNESNVTGFLNLLVAARDQKVKRFVYASSSSVYGDDPDLPNRENRTGRPLSPYAVTKTVNELYAAVFARNYGLATIGLRYFNVFGARQDPRGAYAAVIPQWINAMLKGAPLRINGDGSISRDFCYVANTVQANLLAATSSNPGAINRVFNVALNASTTLNELFALLQQRLLSDHPSLRDYRPVHLPVRPGDILHSQADISLAQSLLGYAPTHTVAQGLDAALAWYKRNLS
jgi:UDP-N-acetylglucosamine 4-epimerase